MISTLKKGENEKNFYGQYKTTIKSSYLADWNSQYKTICCQNHEKKKKKSSILYSFGEDIAFLFKGRNT